VLGQALGRSGPYQAAPWQPEDTVAVGTSWPRQWRQVEGSEATNLQFLQYLEKLADQASPSTRYYGGGDLQRTPMVTDHARHHVRGRGLHATAGPRRPADGALRHAAARLQAISHAELARPRAALSAGTEDDPRPGRVTMRVLSPAVPTPHRGCPRRAVQRTRATVGRAAGGVRHPEEWDGEEYCTRPAYDAGRPCYITASHSS